MELLRLWPGEKILGSTRSIAALSTFYVTDKHLIRSDWLARREKVQAYSYDQLDSIVSGKRRNLSLATIGILTIWSPLSPVLPLVLFFAGVLKRPFWQFQIAQVPDSEKGRWEVWGSGGRSLVDALKQQANKVTVDRENDSSNTSYSLGPENPTLFEKILGIVPGPYAVACFGLAFLFYSLVMILTLFWGTFQIQVAISQAFYAVGNFFAFVMIRSMRLQLIKAESDISQVCKEDRFHRTFRRLQNPLAPILVASVFTIGSSLLILVALTASRLSTGSESVPSSLFQFFALPPLLYFLTFQQASTSQFTNASSFWSGFLASIPSALWPLLYLLGLGTFLWVYFYSLKGLFSLGRGSVQLKHFLEDRMLGARAFGSLSLNLAKAYFVTIGFFSIGYVLSPNNLSLSFLWKLPLPLALSALGIATFFLPLTGIRRRMIERKKQMEMELDARRRRLAIAPVTGDPQDAIRRTAELQSIQIEQQMVDTASGWPFDIRTMRTLMVMAFGTAGGAWSAIQFGIFLLKGLGVIPS